MERGVLETELHLYRPRGWDQVPLGGLGVGLVPNKLGWGNVHMSCSC